jgi:uncharacterized protein
MKSFILGVISDTHGLLRPQALSALQGSGAIVHAGDVGERTILDQLKGTAPTYAVRGNVDTERWCESLPRTEAVQLQGISIYLLHNLHELDLNPKTAGFQIVVSGHTHKPEAHWDDGVLYLNPGSAGPRRFSLPICLGRVDLLKTPWQVEFVDLMDS